MLRIGQIEPTATSEGKYTDGSVAGGIAATRLRGAALNALQEELAYIVEEAGLSLDVNDMTQVLTGLRTLLLSRANPFADIKADGADAVAVALSNLGLGDVVSMAKYGCPLIGELVDWPLAQMPQEIWPDMKMEFIPYMGQTFDAVKYPILAQLHPTHQLPIDMRGEFVRGWDNSRGVDSGRTLLSAQGDAMRSIVGAAANVFTDGAGSSSGALRWSGSASTLIDRSGSTVMLRNLDFSAANAGVPVAGEFRSRNVAWNQIVRAK